MAAKEETVNAIHEAIAQKCLDILDAPAEDIPSATLKAIMGFVKDNNVTCQEEDSGVRTLAETLAEKQKKRATVTQLNAVGDY